MKPALTEEEWATQGYLDLSGAMGHGVNARMGDVVEVTDGHTLIRVPDELRHALAALALYQQPFGFSREDVVLCRWAAENLRVRDGNPEHWTDLDRLAARLESLLPPEAK